MIHTVIKSEMTTTGLKTLGSLFPLRREPTKREGEGWSAINSSGVMVIW